MDLSLKRMQDSGLSNYFSDKEVEKRIQTKLEEQKRSLQEQPVQKVVKDLNSVLAEGGVYDYRFGGKKYKISVLTPSDINLMENVNNFNEQGIIYDLPPVYKFHVTTALGNKMTVQAKTHTLAQNVVDAIFGKGYYRISSS